MPDNHFNYDHEEQEKGAPKWMVTYSDMVTLLLVFFVLLFSISSVDAQKFRSLAESMRGDNIHDGFESILENQYQPPSNPEVTEDGDDEDDSEKNNEEEPSLDELLKKINKYIEENGLEEVISAARDKRGVLVILQGNILFDTASAEIIDEAFPVLEEVASLLNEVSNPVEVQGHTDDRPINTYRYPSNWELSGARASRIVRELIEESVDYSRLLSVGYGEKEPVASNATKEGRQKNRRVTIVIIDTSDENENDSQ
ncbi:flagellar motor protein MotB [Evansella sp. LMS18]|uniref:flagellar motor protein MotS n=1 Tax=Evansella sp. LMS18 TaxID=2924033 RepID=UPI0020D11665|nr:flagellar motor protein MotS [Evansella sp. LMS18]UTR12078.1 flagellar motor protein MotB [Evansella sp. LMS18]